MRRLRKQKTEQERNDNVTEAAKALKEGELELINQYTRQELNEDEVYAFSIVLCDNEIDRDSERFSVQSLQKLSELFVGVTGLYDHEVKSENQSARIFSCKVENTGGETSDGLPYVRLTARAYTPKNDFTMPFIKAVESGMKKEVSVSCSVRHRVCSICSEDIGVCGHIKGRSYDGRNCFATLEEPTDAYEWSFVAVPAQKSAGVIKSYRKKGDEMDIEKRIFEGTAQSFTADEMNVLAERIRILTEKAADGDAYRQRLTQDISRAAAIALPELPEATLGFITKNMNAKRLEELHKALAAKAEKSVPVLSQLGPKSTAADGGTGKNNIYKEI